jgi:dipeptidyl aminopeptidase/acylaminoacyl peptidase
MKSGIYIGERKMKKPMSILALLISISFMIGCVNTATFDKEHKLNLIYVVPNTTQPPNGYPAIIFIHGYNGSNESMWKEVTASAKRGYFAISIDLQEPNGDSVRLPEQINDTKNAIAWLIKDKSHAGNWSMPNPCRIDPDRIGAVGLSAGGILALRLMESDPPPVKVIVSLAGPTNLETEYRYLAFHEKEDPSDILPFPPSINAPIIQFFNELLGPYETEDVNNDGKPYYDPYYVEESPINHINISVPTLILQGDLDNLVPLSQSKTFMEKMQDQGGICDLIVFKFGHNFDPGLLEISCPVDEMDVNSGTEYTNSKGKTGLDFIFEFFQARL